MRLLKVGAAVLNQTPLDWDNNKANILGAIRAAKAEGVSLLCLPELCLCGYGCEDAFYAPGLRRTARAILREILPETQGILVSLGLPVLHRNALFNTVCLAGNGRVHGFTAKQSLASEGLHYEPRWFKPWPEGVRDELTLEGETYPLGDLCFEADGVRVGFEICEDAWVPQRPGSRLARQAVDLILNPSASHFAFGKHEIRRRLVLEGSRAFSATYVYGNLLGNEAGRAIYDGGALIASSGTLLAAGPRFLYDGFHVTTALVDIDATRRDQARRGSFAPKLEAHDGLRVLVDFRFPGQQPEPPGAGLPAWERSAHLKEEEFARALMLGLFDYMRKSRSRGFVVSLSGGADSSSVACLSAMMVSVGCRELGVEAFKQRAGVGHLTAGTPEQLVHALLTCLYQGTENSSDTTRNAARGVAEALNADFADLDVTPLVAGYVGMVERSLDRELTWDTDDLALQNIQARVRGPGAWMLANLGGKLLLSTSNRSEAAVGYATMDGDTCGGLSPIAGIDKAFLRSWLRWLETEGPEGLGPLPALSAVNSQSPTAELRPSAAGQTDEDDLMPYDVLEAIEDSAVGQSRTPVEVFRQLRVEYPTHAPAQLADWVARFFTLWCRNQWKRERYAPSFHVDDKNLDPKTWCRFPILSGGFRRELAELTEFVQETSP